VRFDSPEALRREFEKNIANRGVFVATEADFETRQPVIVEIILNYVDPSTAAVALEGEVVHCVPKELAASGAMPGVAVQFEASAVSLRERFEPLLGQAAATESEVDAEGDHRRGAKRGAIRVPVRVMPTMSPPFEATSRDLSASGILLSMKSNILPLGEIVRVCLWHPSGEPSVEVDGKVVRQVPNKKGRIAAVAVAFDRNQAADPTINSVITGLREAGHRSRLGGISGSLTDLGLANMLQMFGSSAPQGTLVVDRDGEQGWIAFADGQMLGAELGSLSGQDALVAMLRWGDGRFQFEASADPKLIESATPRPLAGAVLSAVCTLDEEGQNENSSANLDGSVSDHSMPIDGSTTFEVDGEQEEASRASLDKTADAVLELVKAGMSVERVCAVIPEPEAEIQSALEALVESGVLVPR
jgi:Tfp pilus assembly protein PilZ